MSNFTYTDVPAAPVISSLSISSGSKLGNEIVVITGSNFVDVESVLFGTSDAFSFTVNSSTSITARTPARPVGATFIEVTTANGVSNQYAFTFVGDKPVVDLITPTTVPATGMDDVVITGTGFLGATVVLIDGVPITDFVVSGSTEITLDLPPHSHGNATVQVKTPNGTSTLTPFSIVGYYEPLPVITNINPDVGSIYGGTRVSVSGSNFSNVYNLKVGSVEVDFIILNNSNISFTSPPGISGTVDVVAKNVSGSSTTSSNSEFTFEAPSTAFLDAPRVAWRFYDPDSDESYFLEVNPSEDSGSFGVQKTQRYIVPINTYIDIENTLRFQDTIISEAPDEIQKFAFNGKIYTKEQYDTLSYWFNKDHAIELRDDLGREFEIYVEKFSTSRIISRNYRWKHSYTVSGVVLKEL